MSSLLLVTCCTINNLYSYTICVPVQGHYFIWQLSTVTYCWLVYCINLAHKLTSHTHNIAVTGSNNILSLGFQLRKLTQRRVLKFLPAFLLATCPSLRYKNLTLLLLHLQLDLKRQQDTFTASSRHTPYVTQVCKMRTTTLPQDFSHLSQHHLASQESQYKITVLPKVHVQFHHLVRKQSFSQLDVQY